MSDEEKNCKLEQVYRLEGILAEFGVKRPIKNDGNLSASGVTAYEKLIHVIDESHHIGAISETADNVKAYCDSIVRTRF